MSRRDLERASTLGFTDVAMAILAPITVLMLAFLVAAGSAPAPECKAADPAAVEQTARELTRWVDRRQQGTADLTTLLQSRCPEALADPESQQTDGLWGKVPVPDPIEPFCLADRDRIVERYRALASSRPGSSGLPDPNTVERAAERLEGKLKLCLASAPGRDEPGSCRRIPEREFAALASQVTTWVESEARASERTRRSLEMRCPKLLPDDQSVSGTPPNPEPLTGYCGSDTQAVLASLPASVQTAARRIRAIERAAHECRIGEPVLVEVGSTKLEFVRCRTEFRRPGTSAPMSSAEISDVFGEFARSVSDQLESSPFNRIDIIGHTDDHPVLGDCSGAKDNEGLSSLRAHAFRRALLAEMRKHPEYREVTDRIDRGDLRIYAIGVGASEPLRPDATTDEDDATNRRVEIKFVWDDYRRGDS